MAKPSGTRTPSGTSVLNISPSEAVLPPTSAVSSMRMSRSKRMNEAAMVNLDAAGKVLA
jgi:hypothetical protein